MWWSIASFEAARRGPDQIALGEGAEVRLLQVLAQRGDVRMVQLVRVQRQTPVIRCQDHVPARIDQARRRSTEPRKQINRALRHRRPPCPPRAPCIPAARRAHRSGPARPSTSPTAGAHDCGQAVTYGGIPGTCGCPLVPHTTQRSSPRLVLHWWGRRPVVMARPSRASLRSTCSRRSSHPVMVRCQRACGRPISVPT